MKKGITPVIAIVLLLMMTIAVGGIAYIFFKGMQEEVQAGTGESAEHLMGQISSCMSIDSISGNKIYLRNCGEGIITKNSLSVYIDGKPVSFDLIDTTVVDSVNEEEVGTVKITSSGIGSGDHNLNIDGAKTTITERMEEKDIIDIPQNNIAGLWHFNEVSGTTADDETGVNDGIINGGATWTTGKFGNALDFDGTNDYVDIGDPADGSLDFGATDSFTISVWVKTNYYRGHIVSKYLATPFYLVKIWGNVLELDLRDDGSVTAGIVGNTNIADNSWHYITAVRDKTLGELRLYVDGVEDATPVADSTGSLATTSPLVIGIQNAGSTNYPFSGSIDEVMILNKALTPDEVAGLYLIGEYQY